MKLPIEEFEFIYSRSGGAGGQNVNKLNTKVTLKWDIKSSSLPKAVIERFLKQFGQFVTEGDVIQITSQRHRTQSRNKKDCLEKLSEMLSSVKKSPKKRIKTKPKKSAIEERLKDKRSKSETKKLRKKIDY